MFKVGETLTLHKMSTGEVRECVHWFKYLEQCSKNGGATHYVEVNSKRIYFRPKR